MAMFCPRCGCNLVGTEKFCPECGNILSNQTCSPAQPERTSAEYLLWFIVGLAVALGIIYVLGQMLFFLFIPFVFLGGRNSLSSMFFMGAMLGTVIALLLRMFL